MICAECGLSPALPDFRFCSGWCKDTFDSRLNPRESSPERAAPTTDAELKALCRKWQARLGLQDWDIDIWFVGEEVIGDVKLGDVEWLETKRRARIRVLEPGDRSPKAIGHGSVEQTVVHELLHLHLIAFSSDEEDPARVSLEQAIHAIAKALLTP